MEIEYQKREVTWCLDREGPRICLRAILTNNKIETLQITSADFVLELDGSEAKNFLDMVWQLTETGFIDLQMKEASLKDVEKTETLAQDTLTTEATLGEKIEEISASKDQVEPEEDIASKIPEPAEILRILKRSDDIDSKSKISSDLGTEVDSPVPSSSEKADTFRDETDIASFFQKQQTKSPLEQLLEEENDEASALGTIEEEEDLYSGKPKIFKPDDLKSDSFISNFDKEDFIDVLKKSEPEAEPEPESEPEMKSESEVLEHQDTTTNDDDQVSTPASTSTLRSDMTPEERRAAIEKERAERRRRLWELTRGF